MAGRPRIFCLMARFPSFALTAALGFGLLFSAAKISAAELSEPAARYESLPAPAFRDDPARPAAAPTAQAIDSLAREDGAAAAATLADKALNASRTTYGAASPRTILPLANRAHARIRAGDLGGALTDYRAAIDLAEKDGGPRDARLGDLWYGLGYAHLSAGQSGAAADAFRNALQLHRITRGLYATDQLDSLHGLAVSQRLLGRVDDADDAQLRRVDIAERAYGADAVRTAEVYVSVGRWFRNVGRGVYAVTLHSSAVEMLSRGSRDDPALFEPLVELALSGSEWRRGPDEIPPPGFVPPNLALDRAEKLADSRADLGPADRAAQFIRIGDVYFLMGKRDTALRLYARATPLLRASGAVSPFDQPVFLNFRVPHLDPVPGTGGYVLAEFSVDASGRPRDPRIAESQPQALGDTAGKLLVNALRNARLRPRLVNGQTVDSPAQRFRLAVRGDSAS